MKIIRVGPRTVKAAGIMVAALSAAMDPRAPIFVGTLADYRRGK